jgi:hypothetical protein
MGMDNFIRGNLSRMPSKINPVTAIVVSRMKPKSGNGILAFFIVSVVRGGAG